MARTIDQAFADFISNLTPTTAQRSAANTHKVEIKKRLETRFGLQSFFESGSFAHGTGVRGKSDVDVFGSLASSKPLRGSSALQAVRDELKLRFPYTTIHISKPAVVLEFGQGYERVEVIPAYYVDNVGGNNRYSIPGVTQDWMYSTPQAHLKYVTAANTREAVKGGAKALARLIKAWKYYRDVPISSFYLEMRCAKYMNDEKSVSYSYDVLRLLRSLQTSNLGSMQDPTGYTGYITSCSSAATLATAKSRLDTAVARAQRAIDAQRDGRVSDAFDQWNMLFNGHFPSRY